MEVLPPPAQFPTSLSPALFSERRNSAGPFCTTSQNPSTPSSSTPASPSRNSDHLVHFTSTPSPTKLVIGSFLPLPTIAASPICTSTLSFRPSSADPQPSHLQTEDAVTQSNGRNRTPPNSQLSLRILFATPTWISTPPTPPHKHIRNLSSQDSWRPSSPVSPSASFPASTPPHAIPDSPTTRLKRCLSVPTMSPRSRAISVPTLTFESRPKSRLAEAFNSEHGRGLRCSKPIFHLPKDTDDCSSVEYAPSVVELSPAESCEGRGLPLDTPTREMKDATRIFHALQELLSTEIDYVRDLRILLIVGIRLI